MLQVGNYDEANDDHQEPRGDLLGGNHSPHMHLIRIFPCTQKGRDILSDPDEKGNEKE